MFILKYNSKNMFWWFFERVDKSKKFVFMIVATVTMVLEVMVDMETVMVDTEVVMEDMVRAIVTVLVTEAVIQGMATAMVVMEDTLVE